MSGKAGPGAVGVVGAGTMGVGIAGVFAAAGRRVVIVEPDLAVRDLAPDAARKIAQLISGSVGALRITSTATVEALSDVDIVIEAAPEQLDIKHAVYQTLFAVLPPAAIVASTTSSILPDILAAQLEPAEAARFLVAHYWNPPHILRLVEIVPGTATARETITTISDAIAATGSTPVVLNRAVPGFIGNRIQFAVLREALHLVEDGVASPEQIDQVVRETLGRRYGVSGPIEAADLGGLPTFQKVAALLMPELASADEGLALLTALVEAGRFGARNGQGFYEWNDERRAALAARQSRK